MNQIKAVTLFSFVLLTVGLFAFSNHVRAATGNDVYLPIIMRPETGTYKIAYVSNRVGGGIYLVDADGQDSTPLVVESGIRNEWPQWSQDGAHLAFRSRDANNKASVRVVDASGAGNVDISAPANLAASMQIGWLLRWSPDNSELAFYTTGLAADPASDEIFVAKTDGSAAVNITNSVNDDERFPDWSPGGDRIVFANYEDVGGIAQSSIVSTQPDGQNRDTLYGPISNHALYVPTYAPDGATIAFIDIELQAGNTGRLVLIDTDGSNVRSYQPPFPIFTSLEWSPDSSKLGFVGEDNGVLHAFTIDAGSGAFQKAVLPTDDFAEVTWSADSNSLIFDAPNSTTGARDLYSLNASSGGVSLILSGVGTESISQGDFSPVKVP